MKRAIGRCIFLFTVVLLSCLEVESAERMVVGEYFTNTSCGGCGDADPRVPVLEEHFFEAFAFIAYHVWWPSRSDPFYSANPEENEARVDYYPGDSLEYGYWYVPRLFLDGSIDGRYVYEDNTWFNMIAERAEVESPLEIRLDIEVEGMNGTVFAHITAEEAIPPSNAVIHFVLIESDIDYEASNGMTLHQNVMRKMLPDEKGEPFTIQAGETIELSQSFSLQPEWIPEQCGFVVFVQDTTTREVHQAAKSRIVTSISVTDCDLIDSEGDGDGNLEAGEVVNLYLSLRNHGSCASDVSVVLTSDDQDIAILTGQVQFEDIPLNRTVANSGQPLVFVVSPDVVAHFTTLTVDVTANGGEVSFREDVEILIGTPAILIVNDDHLPPTYTWDYDAERFYRDALSRRDEPFHVWNTRTEGAPDGMLLNEYDVVIWFTGVSDPAMTPEDVISLTAFLDSGGNLFMSGQDIAADLHGSSFLSDYLHAEFVADSSTDIWLDSVPGDPIVGSLNTLSLASGDYGANNQNSPDEIEALGDAVPVLTYFTSGRTAALRYMNDYRVVYFAVGLESLVDFYDIANSPEMRANMLQRIVSWFRHEPQVGDVNEDGKINILDVILVVNIILGTHEPTPEQEWAADVNEDTTVNIVDAIALVNIILEP